MKLSNVIEELGCTGFVVPDDNMLEREVVVGVDPSASLADILAVDLADAADEPRPTDPARIRLVFAGSSLDAHRGLVRLGVAVISADVSFDEVRRRFLAIPPKQAQVGLRKGRLFKAFEETYSIQQFVNKAYPIIGNPLIVVNSDGDLVAFAGMIPETSLDASFAVRTGVLPESVGRDLEADGILESVRRSRHSVMSTNGRVGQRWINSIIHYRGLELGRFDVLENDRPMEYSDLEVVDYASSLAGLVIERTGIGGTKVGSGSSVLADILKAPADEASLRTRLTMTKLPLDVTYLLFSISAPNQFEDKGYRDRLVAALEKLVPDCLWTVSDGYVFVLVSLGTGQEAGYDGYERGRAFFSERDQLRRMLKNNSLRAFVAEPTSHLALIHGRCRECMLLAQALGEETSPGAISYFWEHRFRTFPVMVPSPEEMDLLLDKRVVALYRYDLEHGTSYFETAVMALRYPGAPAEASEALNVHRNTYFYRTRKIGELFHLDLRDGDDRLAFSFSAHVMEGVLETPPDR